MERQAVALLQKQSGCRPNIRDCVHVTVNCVCTNFASLVAVCVLLSMFEASVDPGLLLVISMWYKKMRTYYEDCLLVHWDRHCDCGRSSCILWLPALQWSRTDLEVLAYHVLNIWNSEYCLLNHGSCVRNTCLKIQ